MIKDIGFIISYLFLLLLNSFFVICEYAFVRVRSTKLDESIAQGNVSAKRAKHIVSHLDAYLSTIQLCITMIGLGVGWIAEPTLADLIKPIFLFLPYPWNDAILHTVSFAVAFAAITTVHVVIGELVPKAMVIRAPEFYALFCARALHLFHILLYLPMSMLTWVSHRILSLTGVNNVESEYGYSAKEIEIILAKTHEEGAISLSKLILLENIFSFAAITLKEVMKPMTAIDCFDEELSLRENLSRLKEKKRTRIPVLRKGSEKPSGYVHIKDMVYAMSNFDSSWSDVKPLIRALPSFTEGTSIEIALQNMQKTGCHMMLVTDKEGKSLGIATLEDIMEEIIGEVHDEFEKLSICDLTPLFVSEAADLAMQQEDKFEVIKHLLERIHHVRPNFDVRQAYQIVYEREQQFPTGIGCCVAIPHGRIPLLKEPIFTVGFAKSRIDFDSPDNIPVNVIFLILTPAEHPNLQIRILSKLAKLISDPEWRAKLFAVKKSEQLIELFKVFDQMTIA